MVLYKCMVYVDRGLNWLKLNVMKKVNIENLVFSILIISLMSWGIYHGIERRKFQKSIKSGKFYQVEIKDEHEVILTHQSDTIKLYFENAYNLSAERGVYIDIKNNQ